jgi:hypothetical protein
LEAMTAEERKKLKTRVRARLPADSMGRVTRRAQAKPSRHSCQRKRNSGPTKEAWLRRSHRGNNVLQNGGFDATAIKHGDRRRIGHGMISNQGPSATAGYFCPLANMNSTSISIGPLMSPTSRRTSSRTACVGHEYFRTRNRVPAKPTSTGSSWPKIAPQCDFPPRVGADIERAGNEVVFPARDPHHRHHARAATRCDQHLQSFKAEPGMLHIVDRLLCTGEAQDLRHTGCEELETIEPSTISRGRAGGSYFRPSAVTPFFAGHGALDHPS